jgi:hypothetical protein
VNQQQSTKKPMNLQKSNQIQPNKTKHQLYSALQNAPSTQGSQFGTCQGNIASIRWPQKKPSGSGLFSVILEDFLPH